MSPHISARYGEAKEECCRSLQLPRLRIRRSQHCPGKGKRVSGTPGGRTSRCNPHRLQSFILAETGSQEASRPMSLLGWPVVTYSVYSRGNSHTHRMSHLPPSAHARSFVFLQRCVLCLQYACRRPLCCLPLAWDSWEPAQGAEP